MSLCELFSNSKRVQLLSPSIKVLVLLDVAFYEQVSYFTTPYLQRENSIIEDKDGKFYLPPHPMSSIVPLSESVSKSMRKLEFEAIENLQENSNSALGNVRYGKWQVFPREKTDVAESMQA